MELDVEPGRSTPCGPPPDKAMLEGILRRDDFYPLRTHQGSGAGGKHQEPEEARGGNRVEIERALMHLAGTVRSRGEYMHLAERLRVRVQAVAHGASCIERAGVIRDEEGSHALGRRLCSKKKWW